MHHPNQTRLITRVITSVGPRLLGRSSFANASYCSAVDIRLVVLAAQVAAPARNDMLRFATNDCHACERVSPSGLKVQASVPLFYA